SMQCIEEAIAMGTSPSAMRFLFVQILRNLPCSAATLFERYKESFCGDFIDQGLNDRMVLNHVLHHLSALLQLGGSTLKDFGLPEPTESRSTEQSLEAEYFDEHLRAWYIVQSTEMRQCLTGKQAAI